ncbi:MAG: Sulfur incorporation enzyme [Candidatus Alkanophagales archaeon MCA70_species_2]|nr:Sulfur incorporation enzyme [Candidatus Alkanophaga liquidiphilum]
MREKTVEEINERIRDGSVSVVTADEMTELVRELGAERAAREVDVVTTGTFGAMCSSGVFLNFGHADPPIKMQRVWLNDVEAYTGIAAVDAYLGATQLSERNPEYGGAHVIEDLISGKGVEVRAIAHGTDCYPRRSIETEITLADLNQAVMVNPRNAYQRYSAATNSTDRTLYTYMGTLLPNYGNATFCGAGELSPLCNDPDYEVLGVGTRILVGGAKGYIIGEGTQHEPVSGLGTLMVHADLKNMNIGLLRAAVFYKYGVTLYIGIGIPIPVLNERVAAKTGVSDEDIVTEVIDYGVPRRDRPVLRRVTYAELKSGSIEIAGREVPTSPLSSFYMARRVAEELKRQIERGEFLLTEPVERLPTKTVFKPMRQKRERPLVRDAMSKRFVTLTAEKSVKDAAKLIVESGVTHIPVVDAENKLVGIVTAWDVSKAVAHNLKKLDSIMTKKMITASLDEPIDSVVRKFERYDISALPVVDSSKRVLGMITSDDVSKLMGVIR